MLTKSAAEAALHKTPIAVSDVPRGPTQAALITPLADASIIGGLSIVAFLLFWIFIDKSASTLAISMTAYAFSFVINSPHFMASYQLLYGDYRHMIRTKKAFFWAAVVSPILLIGVLITAFVFRSHMVLSLMIQGMYLSVGWHYVKQTFGTAIVTSAAQRRFFGKWERAAILLNLYSVWLMSWVHGNASGMKADMSGVSYYALSLPDWCMTASYWAVGLTLVAAVTMIVRKWVETGVWPSAAALVSFSAIYIWYLPVLAHPSFFYLIPFFHSAQYMLFVVTLKWNQSRALAASETEARKSRAKFLRNFAGFFGLATLLGLLSFVIVPEWLDTNISLQDLALGPTMWMFAFSWFINVHHYFIDNVIWRGDNEIVRQHLVVASMERV